MGVEMLGAGRPSWSDELPCSSAVSALGSGPAQLDPGGTHYGAVAQGSLTLTAPDSGSFTLRSGMWFVVPGRCRLEVAGRAFVATRTDYTGLFCLGGPVEPAGRLTYIDGCSDTVLAAPPRRGDPCLNLLVVPPGTEQTPHTHPTLRAGIVMTGVGVCRDSEGDHQLRPGTVWCIPPDTEHAFRTEASSLSVVAFHPDSDTGPTDDDHPMLNRTVIAS